MDWLEKKKEQVHKCLYTYTNHIRYQIIELLKVRSIISLSICFGLLWGFMKGIIGGEVFVPIATVVLNYFFNKRDKSYTDDVIDKEDNS